MFLLIYLKSSTKGKSLSKKILTYNFQAPVFGRVSYEYYELKDHKYAHKMVKLVTPTTYLHNLANPADNVYDVANNHIGYLIDKTKGLQEIQDYRLTIYIKSGTVGKVLGKMIHTFTQTSNNNSCISEYYELRDPTFADKLVKLVSPSTNLILLPNSLDNVYGPSYNHIGYLLDKTVCLQEIQSIQESQINVKIYLKNNLNFGYKCNKKIGGRAEGNVYTLSSPLFNNKCVKIFKDSIDKNMKLKVLNYLIENNKSKDIFEQSAYPQELVYDEKGNFIGYIMRKIDYLKSLDEVYSKSDDTDNVFARWTNRLKIAANLACLVSELHAHNLVIGDFNPTNFLVDKSGKITLIDNDSILVPIKGVYSEVGWKEFYSPELLKDGLNPIKNYTKETDDFALAILIFKLLMNGTHPYQRTEGSIITNIQQGQTPYFIDFIRSEKPTYNVTINVLPVIIINLFKTTFCSGYSNPKKRTSADTWSLCLSRVIDQIAKKNIKINTCSNHPYHQFIASLNTCPWCESENKYKQAAFDALKKAKLI
jgi:hypothetical protein